jgi:hypothetical protein
MQLGIAPLLVLHHRFSYYSGSRSNRFRILLGLVVSVENMVLFVLIVGKVVVIAGEACGCRSATRGAFKKFADL